MAEAIPTTDTLYWKELQEGAQQTIDVNSGWVVLKLDVWRVKREEARHERVWKTVFSKWVKEH